MNKIEKLLHQQSLIAKQLADARKEEAQAKKAALASLTASRKAAVLRAAEQAGLLQIDPARLLLEFQKIVQSLGDMPRETASTSTTDQTDEGKL